MRNPSFDRFLLYACGIVVGIACAGKLWLLGTSDFADLALGLPFAAVPIVIYFEFAFASIIFFARNADVTKMLLSAMLFSLFLIVSFVKWAFGYAHCGCAGVVKIDIRAIIILDLLFVAILVYQIVRRLRPSKCARLQTLFGLLQREAILRHNPLLTKSHSAIGVALTTILALSFIGGLLSSPTSIVRACGIPL